MPRPLVLTADQHLLDDLLRLAAAAGVEVEVADHLAAAAPSWREAPLLIVGHDRLAEVVAAGLPRRPALLVAGDTLANHPLWRDAMEAGAEHVFFLPDAEPWLVDRFADACGTGTRARVVAVLGARGGAGATSFAVAFALAAARAGRRPILVDADPYGGGIDLALGAEDVSGARWDAFADGPPPLSGEALAATLARCGEVTVLAWPRSGPATIPVRTAEATLAACRRGSDLVVVDLPRCFDATARSLLGAADAALLVCPAEVRAVASGRRVAETAKLLVDDLRVVVRGPAPTRLDATLVADALRLPLAGWLDPEPGIARALDEGRPPGRAGRGPLAGLCRRLVGELA
ncbi:MAG TPA: septum site-determining protein Ssd [Mycobacteriales bacterium]|jgi:secretion/DNA translocation related CpaE-like protein|nr:septum site-determining protein Ssd [Mycobacteriales bacterium]